MTCKHNMFRVTMRQEVSSWDGLSSGHGSLSIISIFYTTTRVLKSEETFFLDTK